MNKGYKIKSEISESQVEADVASYFGYITPFWSRRFELIAVDEQETGADKLFNRFVPIYMQFKVSQGLKPLSPSYKLTSPKRTLQGIRTFRRDNFLPDNPILYFKLRNLANGAKDFQHNQLFKMHKPPNKYAVYVAPLSLNFNEYNSSLNLSLFDRFFTWEPFHPEPLRITQRTTRKTIKILPFLRGHISIPPLSKVSTSDHHYSYSKSGNDVAFHSGELIEGDYRLSSFFDKILNRYYNNPNSGFTKDSFIEEINNYYNENDEFERPNENLSTDDRIIDFAKHLKKHWNIKLLALGNENSR